MLRYAIEKWMKKKEKHFFKNKKAILCRNGHFATIRE